jgi:uncharacterized membrane protein YedE/YeeE
MTTEFTPFASLAGGLLIGLAAVLLMALHGRIAGATGILAGVVIPAGMAEWSWRAAMVAGMASGPLVFMLVTGAMPEITVPVPATALVVGGVIVGFGAALGNGCTSGHGVCGIARFSTRSIVATLVFMASTAATVFLVRHGFGG